MKRRGMTLLELLVATSLLSLVLLGVCQTFFLSQRYFRLSEARANSVQSAEQALLMLGRASCHSSTTVGAIYTQDSPAACLLLSAEGNTPLFDYDDEGRLRWRSWVGFRLDPTRRELRMNRQGLTPVVTVPLPPGGTNWFSTLNALPSRTVAHNVSDARFWVDGNMFRYRVTTRVPAAVARRTSSGGDRGVTLEGCCVVRN